MPLGRNYSAHNLVKASLLRTYIICLSKTYLDSTVSSNDANLDLTGYNLVRTNHHPSNTRKCGICNHINDYLPLKLSNIQYLQESINLEIIIGDKKWNFISLYRSPCLFNDNVEPFADNTELNLHVIAPTSPYLIALLGDYNAHTQTGTVLVKQLIRALKLMA